MKQKNAQLDALVDSKKEYLEHLFDLLTEPMVTTFQDIYHKCLAAPETRKKGILACFQDSLVAIASWNQHLIREHYEVIVSHTGCKYIPDLIRALISVQVKINLMANSREQSLQNIKLRVPSADNFVHRCYVDIARAVWKRPYLLYHNVRAVEKQQNLLDLEKIIQQAIRTVIRGCVPMEQLIAQVSLDAQSNSAPITESEPESETETESESSADSETEPESETDLSDDEFVTVIHEDPKSEVALDIDNDSVSECESQIEPELHTVDAPTLEHEPEPTLDVPTLENEPEPEIDAPTLENEPEPEIDALTCEDDHEALDVEPPVMDESKKSVEVKDETDSEDDPSNLMVAKVSGSPMDTPQPMEVRQEVMEKTTPFHMMLMNRKIVRPPSVIMKKKKKHQDAFF